MAPVPTDSNSQNRFGEVVLSVVSGNVLEMQTFSPTLDYRIQSFGGRAWLEPQPAFPQALQEILIGAQVWQPLFQFAKYIPSCSPVNGGFGIIGPVLQVRGRVSLCQTGCIMEVGEMGLEPRALGSGVFLFVFWSLDR